MFILIGSSIVLSPAFARFKMQIIVIQMQFYKVKYGKRRCERGNLNGVPARVFPMLFKLNASVQLINFVFSVNFDLVSRPSQQGTKK